MIICEICKKKLTSIKALSQHIRFHNISSKEYYDKYLLIDKSETYCKKCKKETKFKSISIGYQKFCNSICSNNYNDTRNLISEKKKIWWKDKDHKKNISIKISDKISKKWNEDNSIYKSNTFKTNLQNSQLNRWKQIKNSWNNIGIINNNNLEFELLSKYQGSHEEHLFRCKKCYHTFRTIWNYIQSGKQCPKCGSYHNNVSSAETQILDFIKELNINVESKNRSLIHPREIDILIPTKNIGIEYNGLFWHSEENGKDSNYHISKTNECLEKGIFLIQIFEDEWLFKNDIVKCRLKHILGKSNDVKIYARKCIIKEIDSLEKNTFLKENHIQGPDTSVIKLGAFYNDELISVMTFSHGNIAKGSTTDINIWELNRFCVKLNYSIPGIAGKLLSYFKKNYSWTKIFSYADRRWSKGDLYYKLGFTKVWETKPNYWYISNYRRIHRFNLRKKENEPKDISESQLRKNQGYVRIWDCGNLKFELTK